MRILADRADVLHQAAGLEREVEQQFVQNHVLRNAGHAGSTRCQVIGENRAVKSGEKTAGKVMAETFLPLHLVVAADEAVNHDFFGSENGCGKNGAGKRRTRRDMRSLAATVKVGNKPRLAVRKALLRFVNDLLDSARDAEPSGDSVFLQLVFCGSHISPFSLAVRSEASHGAGRTAALPGMMRGELQDYTANR